MKLDKTTIISMALMLAGALLPKIAEGMQSDREIKALASAVADELQKRNR